MATPQQHQIAELAYRIWEQQGRPDGRDREHWWHRPRRCWPCRSPSHSQVKSSPTGRQKSDHS